MRSGRHDRVCSVCVALTSAAHTGGVPDHHGLQRHHRERLAAHDQRLEQDHRAVGDDAGDECWEGGAIPRKAICSPTSPTTITSDLNATMQKASNEDGFTITALGIGLPTDAPTGPMRAITTRCGQPRRW